MPYYTDLSAVFEGYVDETSVYGHMWLTEWLGKLALLEICQYSLMMLHLKIGLHSIQKNTMHATFNR